MRLKAGIEFKREEIERISFVALDTTSMMGYYLKVVNEFRAGSSHVVVEVRRVEGPRFLHLPLVMVFGVKYYSVFMGDVAEENCLMGNKVE